MSKFMYQLNLVCNKKPGCRYEEPTVRYWATGPIFQKSTIRHSARASVSGNSGPSEQDGPKSTVRECRKASE